MSVSDVSRSLQSWVSTTHRSYSQLTFSNFLLKIYIYVVSPVLHRPQKNDLQDTAWKYSTAWQNSAKYRAGPQLLLPQVGVLNVLCHISRAEEVMRECDTHHTRSIKANSAVNLSRKPGLDLCCDLLQHLQGVPCTRSYLVLKLSNVHRFCSSHHSNFLHVKCNQIQFS